MIEIVVLLMIIAAFALLALLLYAPILFSILLNFPLFWIVYIRAHIDITKKKKVHEYLISVGIVTLLFIILFGILRLPYAGILWWPTLFVILVYLSAQLLFQITATKK